MIMGSTALAISTLLIFGSNFAATTLNVKAQQEPQLLENNNSSTVTSSSRAKEQDFVAAYVKLVNDSRSLTQQYQTEVGKWQNKDYSNNTMASITDDYLPKFQQLVDRARNDLQPTEKYKSAQDYMVQSLDSERQSYEHFRNYLLTGNPAENETSTQFFTEAFLYEEKSFEAFKAAGGNSGSHDNTTYSL